MFDRLGRVGALIVMFVVGCAVAAPAIWGSRIVDPKGKDSFPLSWYPMFSREVKETVRLNHIIGFDAEGNEYRIPYTFFTRGGMNEGRARLNRMAKAKDGSLKRTCKKVAARLAKKRKRDKRFHGVVRVEVVRSLYDPRKYFTGERPDPVKRRVRTRCRVKPGPGGETAEAPGGGG